MPSPERQRRISSIQRQFGGGVKKKVIQRLRSPDRTGFQVPKLRRVAKRPSGDGEPAAHNFKIPHLRRVSRRKPSFERLQEERSSKPPKKSRHSRGQPSDHEVKKTSLTYRIPSTQQRARLTGQTRAVQQSVASELSTQQRTHLMGQTGAVQHSVAPEIVQQHITPQPTQQQDAIQLNLDPQTAQNYQQNEVAYQQFPNPPLPSVPQEIINRNSQLVGASVERHSFPEEQRERKIPSPSSFHDPEEELEFHDRKTRSSKKRNDYGSIPKEKPRKSRQSERSENRSLRKTGSVQFPELEGREQHFHGLVHAGDVPAVRRFLVDHPSFNINCVDYQNTSALQVAIREQNEEMVILLLEQHDINATDAVLGAVKIGDVNILNTVLTFLEEIRPGLEFAPSPDSTEFPDDVTPLMLAAQEGRFEVVDILLKRGHRMPDIHHPYCHCHVCRQMMRRYDRLKYSTMKLNLYKAVASPSYLFQTTGDPILRAFQLTGDLQAAARLFPQFTAEYSELWQSLRQFSAKLIGCCRDAEEVELILKQREGCEAAGQLIYPRLQLAIDKTQKEFVAHPYVQAVLESAWTGEMMEWKSQGMIQQLLAPIIRIPYIFVMFALSCCLPNHSMMRRFRTPVNKFVSSFASYTVFLSMLFALGMEDKRIAPRGPPSSAFKWFLGFFVLGQMWSTARLCFQLGPKRFLNLGWGWFDVAMQLCFVWTFIFWVAAWADVSANQEVKLPRKYWNSWDPTLISEGLLVVATIMAFSRLYLPVSLNYYLGPMQISIGKMTLDIIQFIFIFALLILAFAAGLSHFYQPYAGMVQTDPTTKSTTSQVSSFVSLPMTLKTLFWAIFGMSAIESADVVIENLEDVEDGASQINQHVFTEAVGYFIFAMYQFLAVVVVLNMLVACMANTYTKVTDNVSVEWVFGRTKIYLMYMYHSVLPPPFNILPTLGNLTSAFTWLSLLGKPAGKKRAKFSMTHCCYIEEARKVSIDQEFPVLMTQLAQRYLRLKEEEEAAGDSAHDAIKVELEELKTLVKQLRVSREVSREASMEL